MRQRLAWTITLSNEVVPEAWQRMHATVSSEMWFESLHVMQSPRNTFEALQRAIMDNDTQDHWLTVFHFNAFEFDAMWSATEITKFFFLYRTLRDEKGVPTQSPFKIIRATPMVHLGHIMYLEDEYLLHMDKGGDVCPLSDAAPSIIYPVRSNLRQQYWHSFPVLHSSPSEVARHSQQWTE